MLLRKIPENKEEMDRMKQGHVTLEYLDECLRVMETSTIVPVNGMYTLSIPDERIRSLNDNTNTMQCTGDADVRYVQPDIERCSDGGGLFAPECLDRGQWDVDWLRNPFND